MQVSHKNGLGVLNKDQKRHINYEKQVDMLINYSYGTIWEDQEDILFDMINRPNFIGFKYLDGNDYYGVYFKKHNLSNKDISFVIYFTNISIRHRGPIEAIIKKFVKKKPPKNILEIKAGLILGVAQIFFSEIPPYALIDSTVNLFQGKTLLKSYINKIS